MDSQPRSKKRRSLRRILLLAVTGGVVSLGILELALRLLDPFHFAEIDERVAFGDTILERDDRGGLRLRAGARASYLGHQVVVNGRGLRGPIVSRNKPPGVYRVLVLGDSVAFGWGLAEEHCFPRVLERRLLERAPAGDHDYFEVINCGVPGWGLGDELLFLQNEGLGYQPDLVVLAFVNNDIPILESLPPDKRPDAPSARHGLPSQLGWSYLARALDHSLGVLGAETRRGDFFADLEEIPAGVDACCKAFRLLRDACGEARFVVLDTVGVRGEGGIPQIVECLKELGIPRVAGYLAGPDYRRKYSVSATDDHPNAAGHRVLADALFDWLERFVLQ